MMRERISVIIPAYNEQDRLPATLAEIEAFMKEYPDVVDEVIVVDDGSKDATVERALPWRLKMPLSIQRVPENVGKWGAIHEGMRIAKNDAMLLLDADGSASIYELKRFVDNSLEYLLRHKVMIWGSRFVTGASVEGKTFFRKCISYGYRVFVRFWYWFATGRTDVDDMQAPFKLVYKSRTAREMLQVKRFAGDMELACFSTGRRINHPLRFVHRQGSKVRATSVVDMALETIKVALEYRRWRAGNKEVEIKEQ